MSTATVNGSRHPKVEVEVDERLTDKPTELLECEANTHLWKPVLTNGRRALHIFEYEGKGRSQRISKVADVRQCENCKTIKKSVYWYSDFAFIDHIYTNRPKGAVPKYIEGAPRLTKDDKRRAFLARVADNYVLVAG